MISIIGNFLLILSMIAGLIVFAVPRSIRAYFYYLSSLAPVASFLLLLSAFIKLDFSVKNVFFNSSVNKSLVYRIAGSWSSHEGSICLWVAMLSLMGISFVFVTSQSHIGVNSSHAHAGLDPASQEILTRKGGVAKQVQDDAVQIWLLSMLQIAFVSFIYFTSNPFDSFEFSPKDGLGLNPVLQDMALLIHPPILYLGYVSYVVPFVAACMILSGANNREALFQIIKGYSNFAMATLTIGIALGSWWAYRELGWGGFWFFDPVENISLMPWLMGIALHHFLLITIKTDNYRRITILLSLGCFLTVIFGIFLVRSGIVSSVHSFAFSPERGNYILAICLSLTLVAFMLYVFGYRHLKIAELQIIDAGNHQNTTILIGNILWLLGFSVILIAILYPIYFSYNFNLDIAIDPNYFYSIFLPIFTPLLVFAGIASNVTKLDTTPGSLLILLITIISAALNIVYFEFSPVASITISAAIFLMLKMGSYLIRASNKFQKKLNGNQIGFFLGHFGFGMLALTITLNSVLSAEIKFTGEIGQQISRSGFEVKLHDIKFAENEVYYKQIAEFWIKDKNGNLVILKPENRLYKTENTISQEADIISYLTHDLYAVLSKIDSNIISAEIYYRPLISFVWLSAVIIFLGFVSLMFKKYITRCRA